MIDPRSVAVQGLGFSVLHVALLGWVPDALAAQIVVGVCLHATADQHRGIESEAEQTIVRSHALLC